MSKLGNKIKERKKSNFRSVEIFKLYSALSSSSACAAASASLTDSGCCCFRSCAARHFRSAVREVALCSKPRVLSSLTRVVLSRVASWSLMCWISSFLDMLSACFRLRTLACSTRIFLIHVSSQSKRIWTLETSSALSAARASFAPVSRPLPCTKRVSSSRGGLFC